MSYMLIKKIYLLKVVRISRKIVSFNYRASDVRVRDPALLAAQLRFNLSHRADVKEACIKARGIYPQSEETDKPSECFASIVP